MNNFVVSNPAADFRARWRVLMTSPEGRTTVYGDIQSTNSNIVKEIIAYRIQEPFAFRSTIPDGIRCQGQYIDNSTANL
jgi:hypothetical protein